MITVFMDSFILEKKVTLCILRKINKGKKQDAVSLGGFSVIVFKIGE